MVNPPLQRSMQVDWQRPHRLIQSSFDLIKAKEPVYDRPQDQPPNVQTFKFK